MLKICYISASKHQLVVTHFRHLTAFGLVFDLAFSKVYVLHLLGSAKYTGNNWRKGTITSIGFTEEPTTSASSGLIPDDSHC